MKILIAAALIFTGCATAPKETRPQAAQQLEVCALLTTEEIVAAQGEAFREARPGTVVEQNLVRRQCFFALPAFTDSVALEVISSEASAPPSTVRTFWERHLAAALAAAEREKATGVDLKRKAEPVIAVDGLGESAVWTGNRNLGVLYVLQGDSIIRLSIGGAADVETKIERASKLASAVLRKI